MKHEPITLQKIFDLAWQKFIVEGGEPAADTNGRCLYLTEDGRKCAVGLALPDGHPTQGSGGTFSVLVRAYPGLFSLDVLGLVSDGDGELDRFQARLHDSLQEKGKWVQDVEDRARCYRVVAKEFGLTVPE